MPELEGKIAGKKNAMKHFSSIRITVKVNYIQLREKDRIKNNLRAQKFSSYV